MSREPESRPGEGPSREAATATGGTLPGADSQPTSVESSADASETVSRSQPQHRVEDEHRASTDAHQPNTDTHQTSTDTHQPNTDAHRTSTDQSAPVDRLPASSDVLVRARQGVLDTVTFLAFLAAVLLPFLYLPILLFGALDSTRLTAVLVLVGLHAVCLALGYRYEPGTSSAASNHS